ncbi:MAG: FtsX-like permease family protein [Peptococcaceae bacterium]|nr:FtsX-like permease family protein [Peptococcaceae bacterium]
MSPFWKDIVREIVNTKARFLSLILITLLGSMSVIGIQAAAIDMRDVADKTYKEKRLFDVQLKSATGFDGADMDAIRGTPGVASVMGAYGFDVYARVYGVLCPVRTHSLPEPDGLNAVTLLEGTMPVKPDECLVEKNLYEEGLFALGDRLTLSLDNMEQYDEVFASDTFTIVGVMSSPLYISRDRGKTTLGSGGVSYYLYLPKEAYRLSVFTDVYVVMEGSLEVDNVTEAYSDLADSWKQALENTGDKRVRVLKGEREDAQDDIDQGWLEYADGLQELEEKIAGGREELDKAWTLLNRARSSLISSQNTLNNQISQGLAVIAKKEDELRDGLAALESQRDDLNNGQEEIDQARAELTGILEELRLLGEYGELPALDEQYEAVYDGLTLLVSRQAALDVGREALVAALQQLDDGGVELVQARTTLENERTAAQTKISRGWSEYYRGLQNYYSGLEQLAAEETDAQERLAEAKLLLEEAQAFLSNAPEPVWYLMTRKDIATYESYYQDSLRLEKVGYVFPMVFFLVAILVSLTSMSRMVEEHRVQIGVYKALGYRPGAIIIKYVLYAFLSGGLGGILGVLVGSEVLPRIIADAYGYLYEMPPISTRIPFGLAVFAVAAAVASVAGVTLATCAGAMVEEPAAIMRPKAPVAGKRVLLERLTLVWNRLGFISKVTLRNIFRYKRRFFMTVAGIAGCAALLLTAFGLRDSIGGVSSAQYGEISVFDAKIYLKEITRPEQREVLNGLTPDTRLYFREEAADLEVGSNRSASGAGMTPSLIVPEEPDLVDGYIHLFEPTGGGIVAIPEEGVLVTEKLARTLNLTLGDVVGLTVDNETVEATVAGVVENYVIHYVYMAPQYYTRLFGREPVSNGLLLLGDANYEDLMKNDDVRTAILSADLLENLKDSTDALGVVTIVLLVLACALAFVVLFNLTIININERQRELATIKVLGFQDTETAMYMYRENFLVTFIGILVGLVAGVFLNRFVLTSVEIDLLKFPQGIEVLSYVMATVLSLLFALFVNVVMYRNLVGIDMVESLKSVE